MKASARRWFPSKDSDQEELVATAVPGVESQTFQTRFRKRLMMARKRLNSLIVSLRTSLRKKSFQRRLAVTGVVVVLVGLAATLIAVQTNFDLRNFAWGGIRFNNDGLQGRQISLEEFSKLQAQESQSAALFTQLTQTYFDADVANIDNAEFQVKGVVFKKYDAALDQTLVYARLSNLPLLDAVPAMWLEEGVGNFLPAGVGEIVLENDVPVGYFMTAIEGNATGYTTLNFSYDAAVTQAVPSSIYLSVEFDDPEEGV